MFFMDYPCPVRNSHSSADLSSRLRFSQAVLPSMRKSYDLFVRGRQNGTYGERGQFVVFSDARYTVITLTDSGATSKLFGEPPSVHPGVHNAISPLFNSDVLGFLLVDGQSRKLESDLRTVGSFADDGRSYSLRSSRSYLVVCERDISDTLAGLR